MHSDPRTIMDCAFPLRLLQSSSPIPCGRCMACRINIMRMWQGRILLEARHHETVFVTFTYSEENVPRLPDGRTNLDPEHFRLLLKRIRFRAGTGFRYFGVGEYGDESERAHFHLLAFAPRGVHWPYAEKFWQEVWTHGFVSLSLADLSRIRYCLGYTVKKLTNRSDERLEGRHPEFSRQSRKPPLGAKGMRGILDTMCSRQGAIQISVERDVPSMYRYEGKIYPIGRYWRNWLREQYGLPKKAQEDWTQPDDWEIEIKSRRQKAHRAAEALRRRTLARGRYQV